MRRFSGQMLTGVLACILLALPVRGALAQEDETAGRLVHLLDYIGVDYVGAVTDGKVSNAGEYAEMAEFAATVVDLLAALPPRPERDALMRDVIVLRAAVDNRASASEVAQLAEALKGRVSQAYELSLAPKTVPDLADGARLFADHCASCHGAQGRGDGPAKVGLVPPPSDFHDSARQDSQSLAMLYNTISYGVPGTAMRGFAEMSLQDRWALAFHVGVLRYDAAARAAGAAAWQAGCCRDVYQGLAALTAAVPGKLAGSPAGDVLGYLRATPQALVAGAGASLALTRRLLADSLASYRAGDSAGAYRQALAAYLDGFEPLEQALQAVDPALKLAVEGRMLEYRNWLREAASEAPVVQAHADLLVVLGTVQTALSESKLDARLAFASSFFILLREGLEAVLVLAAMFAFLGKTGQREARRHVHIGWIGALLAGVATWAVAAYLVNITGQVRELSEGFTALLAAVILFYMGFWMHDKAHADRWQAYIGQQLGGVAGSSRGLLVFLSFIAVYREVFETILFYQALWMQTTPAGQQMVLAGAVGGAAALVLTSWLLLRLSARLPIGLFFGASALLMYALAVVFAGKGIASLQEAGTLPTTVVGFPRVDVLGVYPTLQSLAAQLLLLLGAALHYGLSLRQRRAA